MSFGYLLVNLWFEYIYIRKWSFSGYNEIMWLYEFSAKLPMNMHNLINVIVCLSKWEIHVYITYNFTYIYNKRYGYMWYTHIRLYATHSLRTKYELKNMFFYLFYSYCHCFSIKWVKFVSKCKIFNFVHQVLTTFYYYYIRILILRINNVCHPNVED